MSDPNPDPSADPNPDPNPSGDPPPKAPEPKAADPAPDPKPDPDPAPKKPEPKKPIAAGGEEPPKEPEPKGPWPDDWRQKMAEHAAGGDKKAVERELKRLERLNDPTAIYGMYRELEAKFSKGGLTKVPGKDATEEEVKAFHKAIGVPEDPKEYVENLSLPEGVVLGKEDKAIAGDFAEFMHKAGAPQSIMDQAYSWYLKQQEETAAQVDEQDEKNRAESLGTLKEEYGPGFKRHINALSSLFAYAPGGADQENENSLFNRLLTGRTADGRIIGDDPDVVRFMVSLAKEINPTATVVESADGSGKGIDDEIKEIEKTMRSDRRAYDKDEKLQARYRELLDARSKHQARNAA